MSVEKDIAGAEAVGPEGYDWLDGWCENLAKQNLTYLNEAGTGEEEKENRDVCGPSASKGFRLIKAGVCMILQHIITEKLRGSCFGCEVDHPSQIQHSCLYEPSIYYFQANFTDIKRELFKPELLEALERLLGTHGLHQHRQKICGTVEAVVHELEEEPYICEKLNEIREQLVDRQCEQTISEALDHWEGKSASTV